MSATSFDNLENCSTVTNPFDTIWEALRAPHAQLDEYVKRVAKDAERFYKSMASSGNNNPPVITPVAGAELKVEQLNLLPEVPKKRRNRAKEKGLTPAPRKKKSSKASHIWSLDLI